MICCITQYNNNIICIKNYNISDSLINRCIYSKSHIFKINNNNDDYYFDIIHEIYNTGEHDLYIEDKDIYNTFHVEFESKTNTLCYCYNYDTIYEIDCELENDYHIITTNGKMIFFENETTLKILKYNRENKELKINQIYNLFLGKIFQIRNEEICIIYISKSKNENLMTIIILNIDDEINNNNKSVIYEFSINGHKKIKNTYKFVNNLIILFENELIIYNLRKKEKKEYLLLNNQKICHPLKINNREIINIYDFSKDNEIKYNIISIIEYEIYDMNKCFDLLVHFK